jgi:carotenoid cleavage dioxygenase-like enzyme
MNAYDEGGSVVVDVVRHPKMFASDKPGPNEEVPTLDRWTIDLNAGKVLRRGEGRLQVRNHLTGRNVRALRAGDCL